MVHRRGAACTSWAMVEGKKKRTILGPGLFAPDLQETPDSAFEMAATAKKPDVLVGSPKVSSMFDSIDSDNDGKINFEGMQDLVSSLGHEMSKSSLTSAFRSLNSAGVGFVRCHARHASPPPLSPHNLVQCNVQQPRQFPSSPWIHLPNWAHAMLLSSCDYAYCTLEAAGCAPMKIPAPVRL